MDRDCLAIIKPMLDNNYILHILTDVFLKMPQVEIPVKEELKDGYYTREIFMPKGTLAIGEAHSSSFFEVIKQGKVTMIDAEGERTIEAPFSRIASAGLKKFGYIEEDTIWITAHKVKATNTEDALLEVIDTKNSFVEDSQENFKAIIEELKLSEDDIGLIMEKNGHTMVCINNIYLSESKIHGIGIFTKRFFSKGEVIGLSKFKDQFTELSRFVNHSICPNAEVRQEPNGEQIVVALRGIFQNEEITYNYQIKSKEIL